LSNIIGNVSNLLIAKMKRFLQIHTHIIISVLKKNAYDDVRRKNGQGFCCDDIPANAPMRAPSSNDNPELFQYYYHSDHLGSTSLITNLDGEVVQHIEYVPFGEVFIEERNNKWNTPYLFNAKELDKETGLYYYGARYYDSRVSLWVSADPMQEKYPNVSTYNYCGNNPIMRIDPDGREGIVVSGSPGSHDNELHFLINGLDRAKSAQGRTEKGEGTTWIIYNDKKKGFSQESLDKYTAEAKEAGINVQIVSEVDDIVNYINDKTGENSRSNDQISSFYYVGHSTPGDLDVGYAGTGQNFDPSDLKSNAFKSGAWVNVVGGCRTAVDHTDIFDFIPTPFTLEKSIIRQFADILDKKSTIHGSNVKVEYPGGVARDQKLLEKNKGKIITINGTR
jgi:RHS repeat-associated protein